MSVFVVIAATNPGGVRGAIATNNLANFVVAENAWLVDTGGTTQDLAELLGIRPGTTGTGLVCNINSYSGRLAPSTWEWLKGRAL